MSGWVSGALSLTTVCLLLGTIKASLDTRRNLRRIDAANERIRVANERTGAAVAQMAAMAAAAERLAERLR